VGALSKLRAVIEAKGQAALVEISSARGSTPRELGAWMVVAPDGGFFGTIGGGALEWFALARAQALLNRGERGPVRLDQALGPDLGQCCGGHVTLTLEIFTREDLGRLDQRHSMAPEPEFTPIGLFGAGHVGRAVVLALAPLPVKVIWCDERDNAFPDLIPANATATKSRSLSVLSALEPGAQVLIMTHSHALDLEIVAAALSSDRFSAVGVIGSATKRARFLSRLSALGVDAKVIAQLRCPIGIAGLGGKEPAVIAASVAAECLLLRDTHSRQVLSPQSSLA